MEKIKTRLEIEEKDKWNLSALYANDDAWEKDFEKFNKIIPELTKFKDKVCTSLENFIEAMNFLLEFNKLAEKLAVYASLRLSEDISCPNSQERDGRFSSAYTRASSDSSYVRAEIIAADEDKIKEYLEDPRLADFQIQINKILRLKKHTLSSKEEKILAMASDVKQGASNTFTILNNVDLDFGKISLNGKDVELSHGNFSSLLLNQDRTIREKAYNKYYEAYDKHKNTLASLYATSIKGDIFTSRARNFNTTVEMKLFYDNISLDVYTNLVKTINENLGVLHEYYEVRKQALGLDKLKHYDMYVPLTKGIKTHYTYDEAVELVLEALKPLGNEYCEVLEKGLKGNWVDKYENIGKRSGAFSSGSYTGEPYILLNYKEDDLRDVFTLAHEAGHSMHTYYSIKNNPFQHYSYTIFEAETASTVNEQLLTSYLLETTEDPAMLKFLLDKELGNILATLFRQTMFAEFELKAYEIVEQGGAVNSEILRNEYKKLMIKYFGPALDLEEINTLEAFRIPHFYRSFYVYKYATGISAAIVLNKMLLTKKQVHLQNYLSFIKCGGSKYPLNSLKLAGVDMNEGFAVETACERFKMLLDKFKGLI